MSIIGEVLGHYHRHGALYSSSSPAHSGSLNIRRHKSNNSPRSSSLKADALPKCYHQVSSKPGASRLPGHGITITKIFYFKSISCCDQTDPAIAHFIKLWLGFRSLGFREPFTASPLLPLCPLSTNARNSPECPLARYCLLPGYLWRQKASGRCCSGSKTTPKWCLLCDGFIMEWHEGINHDWPSPALYLTSLNCPELWHKSLLWIAIISPPPWLLWSVATLKANQCPVSFGCWVALNINPVLAPALLPLLAITDQQSTAQYASQSSERNKTFPRSQENWINEYIG